jgi:hypothetical protein
VDGAKTEEMAKSSVVVKQYDAKLDSKKRITLRGAGHEYYKVEILEDDVIVLKPRLLIDLDSISEDTLNMIKKSVEAFKKGKASEPVNLEDFNFDKED